jgi:hypothetical protein
MIEERRFNPPRPVVVEKDGAWWPGFQRAWRVCDDGRGWMADVEFTAQYDWGLGKHLATVTPHRVRLGDLPHPVNKAVT